MFTWSSDKIYAFPNVKVRKITQGGRAEAVFWCHD